MSSINMSSEHDHPTTPSSDTSDNIPQSSLTACNKSVQKPHLHDKALPTSVTMPSEQEQPAEPSSKISDTASRVALALRNTAVPQSHLYDEAHSNIHAGFSMLRDNVKKQFEEVEMSLRQAEVKAMYHCAAKTVAENRTTLEEVKLREARKVICDRVAEVSNMRKANTDFEKRAHAAEEAAQKAAERAVAAAARLTDLEKRAHAAEEAAQKAAERAVAAAAQVTDLERELAFANHHKRLQKEKIDNLMTTIGEQVKWTRTVEEAAEFRVKEAKDKEDAKTALLKKALVNLIGFLKVSEQRSQHELAALGMGFDISLHLPLLAECRDQLSNLGYSEDGEPLEK
jgi:chromosome segregation ATPase